MEEYLNSCKKSGNPEKSLFSAIQTKLLVNLNSYKEYAEIYRVIEKDGKGKEYDISTNELKFEGEYKNKKRSGFGKEYEKGKLIYEGE